MMEPYCYFLPPEYRERKTFCNHDNNKEDASTSVRDYTSVFSHEIGEPTGKVTDNGKTLTCGTSKCGVLKFPCYQIRKGALVQSKCRKLSTLLLEYDHFLYSASHEIFFFLKLSKKQQNGGSGGGGGTCIYISYVNFDKTTGKSRFHENISVLEYNHVFNQFSCSLSDIESKIVVVTGRDLDSYGTDQEMADNHLDVLTFAINDNIPSSLDVCLDLRRNLTEACYLFDVDRIFFSFCGTKLFLVFGKSFLVYSMPQDKFGCVFELDEDDTRFHMARYSYYIYNYRYNIGNMLLMCQSDGFVYAIRERQLNLELVEGKCFYLNKSELLSSNSGEDEDDCFRFLHVSHYDGVVVYFTVDKTLYMYDYLRQALVGKYRPVGISKYIFDVKTNWSGEEVFVFHDVEGGERGKVQLEILFISKARTLKEIAKLKVLQVFSREQLKDVVLPNSLKTELRIF